MTGVCCHLLCNMILKYENNLKYIYLPMMASVSSLLALILHL